MTSKLRKQLTLFVAAAVCLSISSSHVSASAPHGAMCPPSSLSSLSSSPSPSPPPPPRQPSRPSSTRASIRHHRNGTTRPTAFPGSRPVRPADLDVLMRQTGQVGPARAAIGIPSMCACRHGFPQAFALDPLPRGTGRANSGLLKLTCPLLVRAVDDLEDGGGIGMFDDRLRVVSAIGGTSRRSRRRLDASEPDAEAEEAEMLRSSVAEAHFVHASVRRHMLKSEEDASVLLSKLGERGAEAFLGSGVAGTFVPASMAKTGDTEACGELGCLDEDDDDDDRHRRRVVEAAKSSPESIPGVKCLHAWLADYIFRGGIGEDGDENPNDVVDKGAAGAESLGAAIARELKERGVNLTGTSGCAAACDPNWPAVSMMMESEGDGDKILVPTTPPKPRNRLRLRTGKERERRRRRRREEKEKLGLTKKERENNRDDEKK